jgi:hypothetical protein
MSGTNNFVYVVMQYDASMGREWALYAFDTVAEAETEADKRNAEHAHTFPQHYVKAVRLFRKEKP